MELGTILGVWAHPDDETYLSAGLMAAAVDAGSRVVDVTATRGEGGSMDEEQWPPGVDGRRSGTGADPEPRRDRRHGASLARPSRHRHGHARCPKPAGAGARDHGAGAARHGAHVRARRDDRPSAHMSVSRWADGRVRRCRAVGRTPALRHDDPRLRGGVPRDLRTARHLPTGNAAGHATRAALDRPVPRGEAALDRKFRAISEHESQIGYIVDAVGADVFRREMANEWFRLAAEQA